MEQILNNKSKDLILGKAAHAYYYSKALLSLYSFKKIHTNKTKFDS